MEAAAPPPAPPPPGPPPVEVSDYPVHFDVEYPERLSRWKIFLKWLFAIPHFIIVYLLGIVSGVLILIAFFAILFTKKWPRSLFDFTVMIQRWTINVYAYAVLLLRDEYPPFSGESGEYPLVLEVEYREDLSRWQIFVKWLLAIPHLLVLAVLGIAVSIVVLIAFFAILFTGRYPRGMFDFVVGTMRWYVRVNAYAFWLMTDRYPPFSLK
jgi:urea transporter